MISDKDTPSRFKGAIFDLDGVIVDTIPLHFEAWKKAFAEFGKSLTFEEYKARVDGIPTKSGARAVLPDISAEDLTRISSTKQRYYLELLEQKGVLAYQSTIDLIDELKAKGILVAVISSSRSCTVILEKSGLTDKFEAIIGGNDITAGKPDPQIFLMAVQKLGLNPSECVVIEDAALGVKAAKAGKFITIGIDHYKKPDRLNQADLVVEDLKEIDFSALKNLFKKG